MNSKVTFRRFGRYFLLFFIISLLSVKISALTDSEDIVIIGQVPGCELEFNIKPEKRIPAINHWMNQYELTLYKSSTNNFYYQFNLVTDQFGHSTIDLCSESLDFEATDYDVIVKGFSHVSRKYNNQTLFADHLTVLPFDTINLQLAGDLNDDNFVNTSDLSIIEGDIYNNTIKNDLNRDGVVNSLDISNLIFNLGEVGEV